MLFLYVTIFLLHLPCPSEKKILDTKHLENSHKLILPMILLYDVTNHCSTLYLAIELRMYLLGQTSEQWRVSQPIIEAN